MPAFCSCVGAKCEQTHLDDVDMEKWGRSILRPYSSTVSNHEICLTRGREFLFDMLGAGDMPMASLWLGRNAL